MGETGDSVEPQENDLTAANTKFDTEWGDPRTYLEPYYPSLDTDPQFVIALSDRYTQLRAARGNRVDINELKASDPVLATSNSEILENYLLLDFLARVNLEYIKTHPRLTTKIVNNGAGPVAYPFAALAGIAEDIVPGEYLETNRQELESWRLRNPQGYDWSTYTKVSSVLNAKYLEPLIPRLPPESKSRVEQVTNADTLDELAHSLTKPPEYINFFKHSQSSPHSHLENDKDLFGFPEDTLAATFFGPESATVDRQQWQNAIHNLARVNNIGENGWVLLATINGATSYTVGDSELPAVNITHGDLVMALQEKGFEIVIGEEITGSDSDKNHYSGMSFILAKPEPGPLERLLKKTA